MQFFDEMLSWKFFSVKGGGVGNTSRWKSDIGKSACSSKVVLIIDNASESQGSSRFSFLVNWSLQIGKAPTLCD